MGNPTHGDPITRAFRIIPAVALSLAVFCQQRSIVHSTAVLFLQHPTRVMVQSNGETPPVPALAGEMAGAITRPIYDEGKGECVGEQPTAPTQVQPQSETIQSKSTNANTQSPSTFVRTTKVGKRAAKQQQKAPKGRNASAATSSPNSSNQTTKAERKAANRARRAEESHQAGGALSVFALDRRVTGPATIERTRDELKTAKRERKAMKSDDARGAISVPALNPHAESIPPRRGWFGRRKDDSAPRFDPEKQPHAWSSKHPATMDDFDRARETPSSTSLDKPGPIHPRRWYHRRICKISADRSWRVYVQTIWPCFARHSTHQRLSGMVRGDDRFGFLVSPRHRPLLQDSSDAEASGWNKTCKMEVLSCPYAGLDLREVLVLVDVACECHLRVGICCQSSHYASRGGIFEWLDHCWDSAVFHSCCYERVGHRSASASCVEGAALTFLSYLNRTEES